MKLRPTHGEPIRALISVYNKDGIVEFAQQLLSLPQGAEIYSSGGTARVLMEAGITLLQAPDEKRRGFSKHTA